MRNLYGNRYFSSPGRSLKERIRRFFTEKSVLSRLLIANIGIFLLIGLAKLLVNLPYVFSGRTIDLKALILPYLDFPVDISVFLHRPWTLLTSLFIHTGFGHLFFNMLTLYVIGRFFLEYLSEKKMLVTYFAGGIVGNLTCLLVFNILPNFSGLSAWSVCAGASGAVMAIMLAITLYRPNHPIYLIFIGRISLKWIAVIFIAIDLLSIGGTNSGEYFAHLGGALYGALTAIFYLHPIKTWKIFTPKVVFEKKKKKYYSSRPVSDADFNAQKRQNEKRADAILDKIARNGYGALSKEEKDFLYHYKR